MYPLEECTLLYVEDDPDLRREMSAYLALHCARVVTAGNGQEALTRLAEMEADLVLTDIRMPELDGLALTERLRQERPQLPVVLYTAFTDVHTLLRGIELGVAGFVQKPTEAGQLIATLTRAALPVAQRRQIAALSREMQEVLARLALTPPASVPPQDPSRSAPPPPAQLPLAMAAVEKWALQRALVAAGGRRMEAARLLEMNYYTFRRHLRRHGLHEESDS